MLRIYHCNQCQWVWANRNGKEPKVCPNPHCHSLRWLEPYKPWGMKNA
jgi:hypothetical protein